DAALRRLCLSRREAAQAAQADRPQGQRLHQQADAQASAAQRAGQAAQPAQVHIVEHPFLTLKRLWGFAKVRYRGLAKNANRAYAMLALINLSKWGRPLTPKTTLQTPRRRALPYLLLLA